MFLEQRNARHDESRRAEAAHQRVLLAEGLLDRVQRRALCQAVDVANLLALALDRERRARIHGAAVDDHRARAARAAIAAPLAAGQIRAHAQRVEQRHARLNHQVQALAVHHQAHGHFARSHGSHGGGLRLRFRRRRGRRDGADDAGGLEEVAAADRELSRVLAFSSHEHSPSARVEGCEVPSLGRWPLGRNCFPQAFQPAKHARRGRLRAELSCAA
jgi:hypothetical protein